MSDQERLQRPPLARSAPNRAWSGLFARPGSSQAGSAAESAGASAGSGSTIDDAVARGVELGYSVISEQLEYGRQFAGQFAGAFDMDGRGAQNGGPLGGELLERGLHFYAEMNALLLGLAESVLNHQGASLKSPAQRPPAAATQQVALASVMITASSPVEVTVQMPAVAGTPDLVVHPLHGGQSVTATISAARLSWLADNTLKLVLAVPAECGIGTYVGVIALAADNQACGTLTAQVHAAVLSA